MPISIHSSLSNGRIDRIAIALSGACAAHCVGTAVVLGVLASAGGIFENPLFHEVGLVLAILLGAVALGHHQAWLHDACRDRVAWSWDHGRRDDIGPWMARKRLHLAGRRDVGVGPRPQSPRRAVGSGIARRNKKGAGAPFSVLIQGSLVRRSCGYDARP